MISAVLLLCAACAVYILYRSAAASEQNAYQTLPWVGLPKGLFAKLRALVNPASSEAMVNEAYRQYSLKNQPFIIHSFMWSPIIVLPPTLVPWIVSQPDDVLSFQAAATEAMTFDITSLDSMISTAPTHVAVVAGPLTRSLALTPEPVVAEAKASIDELWGFPDQFSDIKLYETFQKVAARISNRLFIGEDLCHNAELLESVTNFANSVATSGTLLRPMPHWFQQWFGWMFIGKNRKYFHEIMKHVGPVIEQYKCEVLKQPLRNDDEPRELRTLLQCLVYNAHELADPCEWSTELIAKRYTTVMFAALHTTSITTTHLLLDLISSAPQHNAIETLRAEVEQVLQGNGGRWSKNALAQLVKMDSAIRESMRLNSIGTWSLHRIVVAKDGLTLPDGVHLSRRSHVCVAAHAIQRDEQNYRNARTYDPFRFSRDLHSSITSQDASNLSASKDELDIQQRNLPAVSTSNIFFAFGHGRHACPGRFLAMQEVKLMLSHILLSYDIKPIPTRPPNQWFGDMVIPDPNISISVRRR